MAAKERSATHVADRNVKANSPSSRSAQAPPARQHGMTTGERGPRGDHAIFLRSTEGVSRWRRKLGVTALELRAAIRDVGADYAVVQRYLRDWAQVPHAASAKRPAKKPRLS